MSAEPLTEFHLAQVNVMVTRAPLDHPSMAEFVALLDPVNDLADSSPGFVWRLKTEDGNATAIRVFDDHRTLINLSVWQSRDDLWNFVYASRHLDVMWRRRQWSERIAEASQALWWVEAGRTPTVPEAEGTLRLLRALGPTSAAFTFRQAFPPPGPLPSGPGRKCSARDRDSEAERGTRVGLGGASAQPLAL